MANLPNLLVADLIKRSPNPAPTPTNLAPATATPSPTVTTHPEKMTHVAVKLAAAGLGDSKVSVTGDSTSNDHHNSKKRWIIWGSVIGVVILIKLLILAFFLHRYYKRRRAYAMVNRGVDMSGTPAWKVTGPESETSGPRPLFLSRGMAGGDGREPYRGPRNERRWRLG